MWNKNPFRIPVSFEVGLVADEGHRSVVTAESLVLADDAQISGRFVEAVAVDDRVHHDESVSPFQISLRFLVRLHIQTEHVARIVSLGGSLSVWRQTYFEYYYTAILLAMSTVSVTDRSNYAISYIRTLGGGKASIWGECPLVLM